MREITSLAVINREDERYSYFTVGVSGVVRIVEHGALGEGDRWYYDVHYADGTMVRDFEPATVRYGPDTDDIKHLGPPPEAPH